MSEQNQNLIPEGYYRARVVDAYNDAGIKSKIFFARSQKGNEFAQLRFELLDGGCEGRTISWRCYFTSAALPSTLIALGSLGWYGSEFSELDTYDFPTECVLKIEHEIRDNQLRARVRWVNPLGGGVVKLHSLMDSNEVRAFSAAMRSEVMALRAGNGTAPSSGNNGTRKSSPPPMDDGHPPPLGDDDVPF